MVPTSQRSLIFLKQEPTKASYSLSPVCGLYRSWIICGQGFITVGFPFTLFILIAFYKECNTIYIFTWVRFIKVAWLQSMYLKVKSIGILDHLRLQVFFFSVCTFVQQIFIEPLTHSPVEETASWAGILLLYGRGDNDRCFGASREGHPLQRFLGESVSKLGTERWVEPWSVERPGRATEVGNKFMVEMWPRKGM